MNYREQYASNPASVVQLCRFWSSHVDVLEQRLSADRGASAVVMVALIAYPIARFVIPAVLHGIVPDMVRTVLKLI